MASFGFTGAAEAACTSTSPASSTTDDCSGANTTPVIASGSTHVILNLLTGGTITPASGPSIWLGADADIRLQGGTVTGNNTLSNTYAVLIGDSSIVTLDGTIQSQGGIAGPGLGPSWPGFSNAHVTIDSTGQILTTGTAFNAGLNGIGGNNIYQIDGTITASGRSGEGIVLGDNDQVTVGSTGNVTTMFGDTSRAIDGSGADAVTVTTAAGSTVAVHGIGAAIQAADDANVTVSGNIYSYGDAAMSGGSGGIGVSVGVGATVWLKRGGQIITGNAGGLGDGGTGAVGIDAFAIGGGFVLPTNSSITVDGLIDARKASGVVAGTGSNITVGATGKISVESGSSSAISIGAYTSTGNDQLTIDVFGRVEQLGTGKAIFIDPERGPGAETELHATETIEQGGSVYAANGTVFSEFDGGGSFPDVSDNMIVKGSIARGTAGTAIDLNDGADTLTLFPTYSITGNIDGGNSTGGVQIDTFALDGAVNTTGAFDFGANTVTNFEAGDKKGLGTWTLAGAAGTGINGTFAVEAGRLAVNGTMTSTDFAVSPGAVLGGTGTIKSFGGSGTIAPGNSIGVMHTATGAFGANGTYEVEINPASADEIVATGLVTIDPTAKVSVLAAPGTYVDGTSYEILSAGTRTGAFGSVVDNSAFLDFTLDQSIANQVWLRIATVADFVDVAGTPNQRAAATGLQALGPGNGLFDAIAMLDADSARDAFDLSSGEVHATAKGVILDDSRFIRDAVLDRLDQRFADAFGASPALAYAGGSQAVDATRLALAPSPSAAMWGQGFGSWATVAGDGNAAAFGRSVGGFFAGLDTTETGAWRFGLAAGYQRAAVDVPVRASSASIDTYTVAGYGAFEVGRFALRFGGAVAAHSLSTLRHDMFAGFDETLTAGYGAHSGQVFAEAAYRAAFGKIEVEPFAGLAIVGVATDGFTESGGLAALTAPPQHAAITLVSFGARFGTVLPIAGGALKLTGLVAWQHAFGDVTPLASLAFAGGAPFTVAGVPIGRDVLKLDAGLDWQMSPKATFRVAYSGQITSSAQDHGLNARLTFRF